MEIRLENLYVDFGACEYKYEIQDEFDFGIWSHFHSQICDSFRAHHVNRRNDRIRTISQLTICGTPAWFENSYLW